MKWWVQMPISLLDERQLWKCSPSRRQKPLDGATNDNQILSKEAVILKQSQQGNEGTMGKMYKTPSGVEVGVCGVSGCETQDKAAIWVLRWDTFEYSWSPLTESSFITLSGFPTSLTSLRELCQRLLPLVNILPEPLPLLWGPRHQLPKRADAPPSVSSDTKSRRLGRLGPEACVIDGGLCQTRPDRVSQ